MGRFNKLCVMTIVMMIGIFLLTGCNKFHFSTFTASEEEDNSVTVTLAPQDNENASEPDENQLNVTRNADIPDDTAVSPGDVSPTPKAIQPTANISLPVYTVNVETGEVKAITALVPADSKITPKLIVSTVVDAFADSSIEVGIEEVSTKKDTIIVSFYKDKAPLSENGAIYEEAILDAIAQSLIENLEDYNNVIYRAEGSAYVSGHFEMKTNDVYFKR